jgi:F-type H+-transporting ATPase subunit a
MELSPDNYILWEWGALKVNYTIFFTWVVMALLTLGSWLLTRRLSTGLSLSRGQVLLETVVETLHEQIREISESDPTPYLTFIGTLFIFIVTSNILAIIPGFHPPTGSLSTTAALAMCVFIAVPIFGITRLGFRGYIAQYLKPTPIMLPFNIIGELSRTLALAVRLFGNVMSGSLLVAILLIIVPLFFPVVMQILGLLTGVIQAYIFSVLAMVYIASATRVQRAEQTATIEKGNE